MTAINDQAELITAFEVAFWKVSGDVHKQKW
jgi:hypothetical protein